MSAQTADQLRESEQRLVERLRKTRLAIRRRKAAEILRLAKTYAPVFGLLQEGGVKLPTPEALARLLTKKTRRPRKPKAA